jgi:hypothetical protein
MWLGEMGAWVPGTTEIWTSRRTGDRRIHLVCLCPKSSSEVMNARKQGESIDVGQVKVPMPVRAAYVRL